MRPSSQRQHRVPKCGNTSEKPAGTLPDGTATARLPQELLGVLSAEEPLSGKCSWISLQSPMPALSEKSETSLLLLCFTSEPEGSLFLAKYGGFYSSSSSHIRWLQQTEALMEGKCHQWYFHPQLLISSPTIQHADAAPTFAAGPLTRRWRLQPVFLLHPGPAVKPTVEHTFRTCCTIQPVNQLYLI